MAEISKELEVTKPANLVELAITHGASVETLERLLALQERWEANEARKAFDLAISQVKPLLPEIKKNREGYEGRYKYEDLAEMVKLYSPVLAQFGLNVRWRTKSDPKEINVVCIISHAQGHSEECQLSGPPDHTGSKNAIQAIGSAVAYLQRYTMKAGLGTPAAPDDDAQAFGRPRTEARKQPPPQDPRPKEAIKSARSQLGVDLLAYCNADKDRASQMLFELTGKRSIKEVDNDLAKKAREALRELMEQFKQPGPDDDFPDFKSPEEQAKADDKTAELFEDAERAKPTD